MHSVLPIRRTTRQQFVPFVPPFFLGGKNWYCVACRRLLIGEIEKSRQCLLIIFIICALGMRNWKNYKTIAGTISFSTNFNILFCFLTQFHLLCYMYTVRLYVIRIFSPRNWMRLRATWKKKTKNKINEKWNKTVKTVCDLSLAFPFIWITMCQWMFIFSFFPSPRAHSEISVSRRQRGKQKICIT